MPKVGFGLERLGLVACRWPWATIAVHVLVTLFCAVGFARIEIDSQLGEMFRSDSADYQIYKNMKQKFPASGSDILVVLEGDKLLARETIERLRDLHLELQFVDGADAVLSMFSVRRPPDKDGFPAPLFPDELPEGEAFDKVIADVRAHPLTRGKFLSGDGKLGLMILALKRTVMETAFAPAIAATRLAVDEALAGTGVTASLTGVPVMRDEIAQAIRHDRITYNLGGFLVGCLVSFLFFRNLAVVAIGSAAPGAAVLWSFGVFGWLGQELNVMIVVVAPLVMVIAFSDAMHMLFGIRRGLDDGLTIEGAVKRAVSTIGPACVLTSLTTALALLSLWFAESEAIRNFGIHAAGAAGIAFLSGGQSDVDATAHLNLMNSGFDLPWPLTFSYGRALQAAPLKTWAGKPDNVPAAQEAFSHRARMNGLASLGEWSEELEAREPA